MPGEDIGFDGFIDRIEKQVLAETGAIPSPPPTSEAIDALPSLPNAEYIGGMTEEEFCGLIK